MSSSRRTTMSIPPFNSVNEVRKPLDKRRYHNNKCGPGNEIPRRKGGRGTQATDSVSTARI
jgi:hypothetical protein